MKDKILIEIEGEGATPCAERLARILEAELGEVPERVLPAVEPPPERETRIDPGLCVAAAGVVLAIPGAILATLDLRDRLRKKRAFERVVEGGKGLKREEKVTRIRFRSGSRCREIEEITYAEISEWK